jgi:Flp pilus assembly protein TadG
MMTKPQKRQRRDGALSVEFALVLPILMTALFAFFEISRASMIQHATEAAAYEGARVGIIPGATPQKIEQSVQFVLNSVGVTNFRVDVSPANITNQTQRVSVTVNVPFSETNTGSFLFGDRTFRGATELGRETL